MQQKKKGFLNYTYYNTIIAEFRLSCLAIHFNCYLFQLGYLANNL